MGNRFIRSLFYSMIVAIVVITVILCHTLIVQQAVKLRSLTQGHTVDLISGQSSHVYEQQQQLQQQPRGPISHIGFLKVHKAASTTTQAIFLRYGWRKNLTFVLPPEYNAFGYPNIISLNESVTKYNTLPPPQGKNFDILCHHVVYGKTEWDTVLPKDSAIIGTVREPFRLFRSILNYFNPREIRSIQAEDKVFEYLKQLSKSNTRPLRFSFTNNRLAFEYGVHPDIIEKRDFQAFDKYLHEVLDKTFILVILAEKFDESLVLMKRKLNWDLNDIMYAIKNVRSEKKPDNFVVNDTHKPLHRNVSIFDYMLYEFFEKKLQQQIEEEGPSFQRELNNFREARVFVENFCHNVPPSIKSVTVAKSEWNAEFEITRDDCRILHRGEIDFTQAIRTRQYGSALWRVGGPRVKTVQKKPG